MRNINELIGIIQGISFDGIINQMEMLHLQTWINKNRNLSYDPKQSKLIILVDQVLEDHIITDEERDELLRCCDQFIKESSENTSKMYELNGIIEGVICDGVVNESEIYHLRDWMLDNRGALSSYKEAATICDKIDDILSDGIVTQQEQDELLEILTERINKNQFETKIELLKKNVRERVNIGIELIDLLDNEDAIVEIHRRSEEQLEKTLLSYSGTYLSDPEIVFISLVLIAMLHYDGCYYEHVRHTYVTLYQQFSEQKIEGLIRSILSRYRSEEEKSSGSRIINTVLSNSIVPSKFLPSFFEFIYDIYKLNLEYDVSEDMYNDFKFIYEGLRSSMLSDDDNFQLNVTKKSYKLIKSTKQLIVNSKNIDAVIKLSIIVVQMIDKRIWNKEIHLYNPYLKLGYEGWISTLNVEKDTIRTHKKTDFRSRWEPKFILSSNKVCIVPPIHRIKAQYDYRDIYVVVKNNNQTVYSNYSPDIREIIGGYQVSINKIELDNPIGKITYMLMADDEIIYDSRKRLYRDFIVFDEKGSELKNNTDYCGTAVFCVKHATSKMKVFYQRSEYLLASASIRQGDTYCLENTLFNFSALIQPGIVGELYDGAFLLRENTNIRIQVYKQAKFLVYECENKFDRFNILINGHHKKFEELVSPVNVNEGVIRHIINIENMKSGVYFIEVYGWNRGKEKKVFDYTFAIDDGLKTITERINGEKYLISIESSLTKNPIIEEIEIEYFNEDWLQIEYEGKKYNYLIPYDMELYRINGGKWLPFDNEIWIDNIHQDSIIEIFGCKYDKMTLLTSTGKIIEETPELKTKGLYLQTNIGFLVSYKSSCDYVILSFLIDGIIKNSIYCYNKCVLDDDKTIINFDPINKMLSITPRFHGKGNIFFRITTGLSVDIYESSFLENGIEECVYDLQSFVNYTITFYERKKGLSLKKERILKSYERVFYAREDFVGRSFKIKKVYYDQYIRGKLVRKKHYFNTTYLNITERIDNDNFVGDIYVKTLYGAYMLDKVNPVDIEICSDVIDGIIEIAITKDGDGLLLDFDHHGIKNTLDDGKAVDIFSYNMDVQGEEMF